MSGPSGRGSQRILLQTTIPYTADDWNVSRFSLVAEALRRGGHDIVARDRSTPAGFDDPILSTLARKQFDQLWLFAVDNGDGITHTECTAIATFRGNGGAVFIARDHMDLGSSVCSIAQIGAAHNFHSRQPLAPALRFVDDAVTTQILWPNFHSGSNGDVQCIEALLPVHPVLHRPNGSSIEHLPAHPHEGAVTAPSGDPTARVVAIGTSKVTGHPFNIAVAFEGSSERGRSWAESTFHHFADYNWDPRLGCPSFVTEAPSDAVVRNPSLLDDTRTYVANLALWLGGHQ